MSCWTPRLWSRGDKQLQPRFSQGLLMHVPWVVLGELHFGAQRAQRREEQLTYIRDLLKYSVLLFPDQRTTEHYGQIKAELVLTAKPIPDNDLWIAAIARQYELPLATRDAHFAQVPSLQTLAW